MLSNPAEIALVRRAELRIRIAKIAATVTAVAWFAGIIYGAIFA